MKKDHSVSLSSALLTDNRRVKSIGSPRFTALVSLLIVLFPWAGCSGPSQRLKAHATVSPSPGLGSPRPQANILGKDIRLIAYHNGPEAAEASPEIAPRKPIDLVINDCRGFKVFNTATTSFDSETSIAVLEWFDPGMRQDRTLTILGSSPSCRAVIEHLAREGG